MAKKAKTFGHYKIRKHPDGSKLKWRKNRNGVGGKIEIPKE